MKVKEVVNELELGMEESQNQRDARVEALWKKLDFQNKGELDWKGLQSGLRRIDHPMKNADGMLKGIIKVVDTNGDGKIQYEEFRVFVEAAERQLFFVFKAIDRDHNGKLDKDELQAAFQRAGLVVSSRRLDNFFEDIDINHDGFITFDEWSNFLLFMPNHLGVTTLRAVFTFYSDIVTLTSEGDSVVSDETLEGLGTTTSSYLLQVLFGSILKIASSPSPIPSEIRKPSGSASTCDDETDDCQPCVSAEENSTALPEQSIASDTLLADQAVEATADAPEGATGAFQASRPASTTDTSTHPGGSKIDTGLSTKPKTVKLIRYIPDPGYFVAGAIAGAVSRTATAPLDRLKVYLVTDTNSPANAALNAAKKGHSAVAAKNASRGFLTAVVDIYRSGGVRGFFAGNGLNVIKIMPETAIRFGAYEAAKKTLAGMEGHGDPAHIRPSSKFVAGGVAGMVAQFCVYPLDTLKFRLQSEYVASGPRGMVLLKQTLRNMYADGGVRAAYRGVTMGLIGMFPYAALDMGTFELLKSSYISYQAKKQGIHEEDAQPSTFITGIMGASSGAFGATVVYPLNVLRTRLQTQGTTLHPAHYNGIVDVAYKTVKNEGVRALYKGLMPNILKVAPALSITWMVYENTKKLMNLH